MKKILAFVSLPPPYAGPEITTHALFDGLKSSKGSVVRIVRSNVRTNNAEKGKRDFIGVLSSGRVLARLFFVCLCYRPDTVYFLLSSSKMGFLRDFFIILISKIYFCSVMAHYHGSNFRNFYEKQSRRYQWIIRMGLKNIDKLILQAECLKPIFENLYPLPQIEVLPNGVSPEFLKQSDRAKKDRTVKMPVSILFINHISFAKGFYDLILAFEELKKEGTNPTLLIAGDLMLNVDTQQEFLSGASRKFYEEHSEQIHKKMISFLQNSETKNSQFFGIVDSKEKLSLYEKGDIFVLPSYTEGFPTSVLEAMAFGMPLIVSSVGAIPEVLIEKENALFVAPGNTTMLASLIKQLLQDVPLRKAMGEANRKLCRRLYSMDIIQERFARILS